MGDIGNLTWLFGAVFECVRARSRACCGTLTWASTAARLASSSRTCVCVCARAYARERERTRVRVRVRVREAPSSSCETRGAAETGAPPSGLPGVTGCWHARPAGVSLRHPAGREPSWAGEDKPSWAGEDKAKKHALLVLKMQALLVSAPCHCPSASRPGRDLDTRPSRDSNSSIARVRIFSWSCSTRGHPVTGRRAHPGPGRLRRPQRAGRARAARPWPRPWPSLFTSAFRSLVTHLRLRIPLLAS